MGISMLSACRTTPSAVKVCSRPIMSLKIVGLAPFNFKICRTTSVWQICFYVMSQCNSLNRAFSLWPFNRQRGQAAVKAGDVGKNARPETTKAVVQRQEHTHWQEKPHRGRGSGRCFVRPMYAYHSQVIHSALWPMLLKLTVCSVELCCWCFSCNTFSDKQHWPDFVVRL